MRQELEARTDTENQVKQKPWLWVYILPLIAVACGLTAILIGQNSLAVYKEWYAVDDYQPTQATITESERIRRTRRSTNGTGDEDSKWDFHVRYTYEVDGKAYLGKRYKIIAAFYHSTVWREDIDEYVAYYKVGSEHTVYYDPANPEKSVIKKRVGWTDIYNQTIYPVAFCLLFGFFAFLCLLGALNNLYFCLTEKQPPITVGMILNAISKLRTRR